MKKTSIAAAVLSLLGAGTALAGPQYSADTVQMQPGHEMRSGKLYVSDKGVRFEYQNDGQPIVQVLLPTQNMMRVMFPLTRTYIEIDVPHGATLVETRPEVPCKTSAEMSCVKEGDDPTQAGVQRWLVRSKTAPAIHVWWDSKRKMAVREEYMDGRVMQATLRGAEQYEGRTVEGWEIVYLTPNGQYRRAISLYAPELGIAVVEQQPGGSIRELRNIQVGPPDAKLFALPENYKKVESPVMQNADAGAATMPDGQAPAAKTDNRLAPPAATEPQQQPTPQPHPQQPQGMPPMPMQPGAFSPGVQPQMHGPGMMVVPEQPASPQGQAQTGPVAPGMPMMMQAPSMMIQGPGMMMPQQGMQPQPPQQPQSQSQSQPPQPSAPQWAPPNGQPQATQQPPAYPGYGPQPFPPAPYGYPNAVAPTAPQTGNANGQPVPAPAPAPMQPAYPGYMQSGPFGPYSPPGFAPMQPPAPAPDTAATAETGTSQLQPSAPTTTSAKGGKKP